MTMDEVTKQGLPGAIFALIALDCKDYSLPEGSEVTREALVDYILENEYEGGGWAIIGDSADVDVTAQALQALTPYMGDEKVAAAAEPSITSHKTKKGAFAPFDYFLFGFFGRFLRTV